MTVVSPNAVNSNLSSGAASLLNSVKSKPVVTPPSTAPTGALTQSAPVTPAPAATVNHFAAPVVDTPAPPLPLDFFEKGPEALNPPVELETPTAEEVPLTPEEQKQKNKEDNLAALRRAKNETEERLNALSAEYEEAKSKLHGYESGEIVPEKISKLEERVGKLEPLEKLHAFKLSEEYEREYITPIEQLKTRAEKLAQDYAVDVGKLNVALKQSNKRERNQYLSKLFGGDEVAAHEAKLILDEYTSKLEAKSNAEKNASAEWDRIRAENQARKSKETEQLLGKFKSSVRTHWTEAFEEIKNTGSFPELTQPETDPQYTAITKPLIEASQKNMGMMMRWLAEQGVKEIPREIGDFLAKSAILSQVAPITAASRAEHNSRAAQLLRDTQRQNAINRPAVGSRGNGLGMSSQPTGPRQPRTPEQFAEAAAALLPRK